MRPGLAIACAVAAALPFPEEASARCLEVATPTAARCFPLRSRFQLSWVHSVERTAWRETYHVRRGGILLVASEFSSAGAGLPDTLRPGEIFRAGGGKMRIEHRRVPIPDLRIHLSPLSHHLLHIGRRTIDLNSLFGDAVVSVAVRRGEHG